MMKKEKKKKTSSRTSLDNESSIALGRRITAAKHVFIQAGVDTKISGGSDNATFCRLGNQKKGIFPSMKI